MLVFIDESGDAGFKLDEGSSPIFVAAMVIFQNGADALSTQNAIFASEARRVHKGEFKFNKTKNEVRDLFFSTVRSCPFMVRAVVVRKELIYSPRLKTQKEAFYGYFVKSLLRYDNDILKNARVIIDGSGDREFRRNMNVALRRRLGAGVIRDMSFKDSKNDTLVQLADMCAGAIARSYRRERADRDRWRKMLLPRINDVWEFE